MNLKNFNNLVDLYFYQAKKENSNTPFLEWLNPKNKKKYTWGETSASIQKLAEVSSQVNFVLIWGLSHSKKSLF